mgnify:CR=1 FL=1
MRAVLKILDLSFRLMALTRSRIAAILVTPSLMLARVLLHGGADVVGDVLCILAAGGIVQSGNARQCGICSISGQWLVDRIGFVELDNVVACSAAKYQQIQQ